MGVDSLPWTGDPDADRLLAENPFALLMGMLLDQQFPMERAFYGPYLLQRRLGEPLTPPGSPRWIRMISSPDLPGPAGDSPVSRSIRQTDPCAGRIHRRSLRRRRGPDLDYGRGRRGALQAACANFPDSGTPRPGSSSGCSASGSGAAPPGWEAVAADWPSIADVGQWEDVFTLRQQKREMKAAKKGLKVSTSVVIRADKMPNPEEGD